MGEMRAYISEGQAWAGSPPQKLCLCASSDVDGCCKRDAVQGRPALRSLIKRSCDLPLISQCDAAYLRKQETGRAQILLLFEVEPMVPEMSGPLQGDVCPVAVCCLEKITHPDLLHALAGGFDMIFLQTIGRHGLRDQLREVELACRLGAADRIKLFNTSMELLQGLSQGVEWHAPVDPRVLAVGSRRDSARASAAALLPLERKLVPLPDQSPYGAVVLDRDLCNSCSSCVWVCPSDALSLSENGCELNLVETNCVQCGLCVSICPQRALGLAPQMDLSAGAVLPLRLAPASPRSVAAAETRRQDVS